MAEGNPNFGTDGIVALTLQHYMRNLVDQVFQRTVLLHLLGGDGAPESKTGRTLVQELLYGDQSSVGSFADDDIFPQPSRGGITAAEFAWSNYHGSVFFTGEEIDVNSGPEQAVSLLKARIRQVERTMAKDLNAMFYGDGTGNGGKDFLGLAALINATNTFGGIDRTDALNAWWRASITNVAGVLTEAALRTKYNDVTDGSEGPSNIITSQAGYEAYEGLLQGTIRNFDTDLADAGFNNLLYKDTPMVFDRDSVAGEVVFLNMDHVMLKSLNGAWFRPSGWLIPTNQDGQYKNIILRGQLATDDAALQGKLTGVTNA